ncbi:hypothetical protein [Terrihabitans sp. B22-R8]|uniref:hypothetical protein n=1 Tax=Terrihabitans sp. B22-R8 TaxID=3425128 RepID=UPI00403C06A4
MWKISVLVHMMAWAVLFGFGTIMILTYPELTERFGFEVMYPWAFVSFLVTWPISHYIAKKYVVMHRRSPVTGEKKPDEPLP